MPTKTPAIPTVAPTPRLPPTATFTRVPPTPTALPTPTITPIPQPPARLAVRPPSGSNVVAPGTFTIANTGGQPLTWTATVTTGYALSATKGTLNPGQSVSVSVTVPPAATAAPLMGTIAIASNGGSATLTCSYAVIQ